MSGLPSEHNTVGGFVTKRLSCYPLLAFARQSGRYHRKRKTSVASKQIIGVPTRRRQYIG